MKTLPGLIFVVDTEKEHICVHEAKKLGIPMVGLIDTNCNPEDVTYCIPGNDDAIRAVKLISSAIADAVIEAREGVQLHADTAEEEAEQVNLEEVIAEETVSDATEEESDK